MYPVKSKFFLLNISNHPKSWSHLSLLGRDFERNNHVFTDRWLNHLSENIPPSNWIISIPQVYRDETFPPQKILKTYHPETSFHRFVFSLQRIFRWTKNVTDIIKKHKRQPSIQPMNQTLKVGCKGRRKEGIPKKEILVWQGRPMK